MKRRFLTVVTAALVAVGGVGLISTTASAATVNCATGVDPGPQTGSVIVPAGVNCNIQGDAIGGSVIVNPGGTLILGGGSTVGHNVVSSNAGSTTGTNPITGSGTLTWSVISCNTTIGGQLTVTGSSALVLIGDEEGCGAVNTTGNVSFSNNKGGVEMFGATDGANVAAGNNKGVTEDESNSVEIVGNTIQGNLSCSGNAGGVAIDGGNTAAHTTGQCAVVV